MGHIFHLPNPLFTWQQSCPHYASQPGYAPLEQRCLPRYGQGWTQHSMEYFNNFSGCCLSQRSCTPSFSTWPKQRGVSSWVTHEPRQKLRTGMHLRRCRMIYWGPLLVLLNDRKAWSLLTWSWLKCWVTFSGTWQRKDWCIWSLTVFRWRELDYPDPKFSSCSCAITGLSLRATHWCSDNPIITLWSWRKCMRAHSNTICHTDKTVTSSQSVSQHGKAQLSSFPKLTACLNHQIIFCSNSHCGSLLSRHQKKIDERGFQCICSFTRLTVWGCPQL